MPAEKPRAWQTAGVTAESNCHCEPAVLNRSFAEVRRAWQSGSREDAAATPRDWFDGSTSSPLTIPGLSAQIETQSRQGGMGTEVIKNMI